MRRGLAAVGLTALAVLAGCSASPEPVPPTSERGDEQAGRAVSGAPQPDSGALRIVFLGDSLSAGFGVAESEAFPARIEQALLKRGHAVAVINAGVSGDTSAGGLSRMDWVLRSRPDILVVELGGNDALRGQPLTGTEANLRGIIERGQAAGARVLLLGMDVPTNLGPQYAGDFNELYARIASDLDVAFVPEFIREVGLKRSLMQPDGIHPTAAGHRRLAEQLVAPLETLLNSMAPAR